MPRLKLATRPARFVTNIPEDLKARLDLSLFSELENRIPYNSYQELLILLLQQHFDWKSLDLEKWGLGPGSAVRGPPHVIEKLEELLKSLSRETEPVS